MTVEQISRAVFWTLAAMALTGVAALIGCVGTAVQGDSGPAALFSIPIALQILVDLYCMLTVRQGALEVAHPTTVTHRLLIMAALSIETVVYLLLGRVLLQSPAGPHWVIALVFARGGIAAVAWIGAAAALWISRDTPNRRRRQRQPDQSTGLPDDEMAAGWDEVGPAAKPAEDEMKPR